MLAAVTAHGAATLEDALKRREVCGLLLGLLCHPGLLPSGQQVVAGFYALLLPVAATSEAPTAPHARLPSLPRPTPCPPSQRAPSSRRAQLQAAWELLSAILPAANRPHAVLLQALVEQTGAESMSGECAQARSSPEHRS